MTLPRQIRMKPIGVIHTPFHEPSAIPIQGRFKPGSTGWLELNPEYVPGLQDLDGFSHAILVYRFHRSKRVTVIGQPYLEQEPHGIFSIRSPHRPNHLGLTVVLVKRIEGNCMHFSFADMLDGTPLLDIKPYVSHFDCFPDAKSGWLDKHFVRARE